MSKETKSTAPSGILAKVMAAFNLGTEGKYGSFFQRELKKLNSKKRAAEGNIANLEFNAKAELDKLRDKLEDAQDAQEQSYLNVTEEQVATNALQEAHSAVYWAGIDKADAEVTYINDQIKNVAEQLEKDVERQNKVIALIEARIATIEG
jgi:dGTP triphosphohydrolase